MDTKSRKNIENYQRKHALDPELSKVLLFKIADTLESANIDFWLAFGTALGAKRNGSVIPFDLDMDLGIRYEDIARTKKALAPIDKEKDFKFIRDVGDIITYSYLSIPLDIYFFKEKSDGKLWCHNKFSVFKYEVMDFDRLEMLGREFNAPRHVEEYLKRLYGKDWIKPRKGRHAKK